MGIISYEMEITSSIPASKMFKAFVLDSDTLIPKILPQAIKSVETIEGDGGPGSIKFISFGEGSQFTSVKHRVDGLDKENLTYSYSIFEGDALMDVIKSISNVIKVEPTADGGSVCKNSSTYHSKNGVELKEDQIKEGKQKALGMFKAVEAYLLANPDVY